MVLNTNPCYIYCLSSNSLLDNLTVIAHATGHNDFFKNNIYFSATDTNMLNKMANHGTRIRNYMTRWGKEKVLEFIDWVMRIDTLIDGSEAWSEKVSKNIIVQDQRTYHHPKRLSVDKDRLYMDSFINTKEFKEKENQKVKEQDIADEIGLFKEPTKNILGFLRDNAPLKPWQSDIISMLYDEAMYFFPQRQTKVLNEGHACLRKDEIVLTNLGYFKIGDIVNNKMNVNVHDGYNSQRVTNWFAFENRKVFKLTTNRGYSIEGSDTHRIFDSNLEWKKLSDFKVGDTIVISHNNDIWPTKHQEINWKPVIFTKTLSEISVEHKIDRKDVYVIRKNRDFSKVSEDLKLDILNYEKEKDLIKNISQNNRKNILIPTHADERLGSLLGYMCGDGHITESGRSFGMTSGDESQIDHYINLVKDLFGVDSIKKWDDSSLNGRWRAHSYSLHVEEFFKYLGFEKGFCARRKKIPDIILNSPKEVMSSFIRSYFDCDGYAGECGIILSTSSHMMAKQIQVVLLNYGILSNRLLQDHEIYNIQITGLSAKKYYEQIGFSLDRKQNALKKYVIEDRKFFMTEKWLDTIVSVDELGEETVYDITVENTHRYVAQGFMNHNSMTDSVIMAEQGFVGLGQESHDCGIVEYAQHKMGVLGGKYSTNPYKLGYYLLNDIRERWDKGRFGPEWEDCDNLHKKENWNIQTNLGKEKIFEVRKYYNDLTLIHEFFTEDFCRKQEYFHWVHYPNGEFRLENRDYKKIKKILMQKHVNGGLPDIRLTEPNYRGQGAMMLEHTYDGRTLYEPYVSEVLIALRAIWGKNVYLSTKDANGKEKLYCCYGIDPEKDIEVVSREDHEKENY
jgi:stage V sporulation protein R